MAVAGRKAHTKNLTVYDRVIVKGLNFIAHCPECGVSCKKWHVSIRDESINYKCKKCDIIFL